MEQIIKKINMIDILGMLLPGGLMLLLLEMDFEVLGIMGKYFGFESGNLMWTAIFLCASYFLGMLLHELGSVIEKLMWRNPLLNPRVYAAISTGLLYNYGDKVEAVQKTVELKTGESILQENDDQASSGRKNKNKGKKIKGNKGRYIWRIVSSFSVLPVIWFALGETVWWGRAGILLVLFCSCVALHWQYTKILWKTANVKLYRERMHQIVKDERVIQKESITSEENSRKYGLFCGYYSLMRSVLVLMAILQIYVIIQARSSGSHLVTFYEMVKGFPAYPYLRYVVVTALALRYWHYACAKFTYTYNGYINNKLFPKGEEKATRLNVELKHVSQIDVHKRNIAN